MRRAILRLGLLATCVAILAGCGRPTLDRDGGYVLTYPAQPGESVDAEVMVEALNDRLRAINLHHGSVRRLTNGDFAVELPGVSEGELALVQELLAMEGELELRILADHQHDAAAIEEAVAGGAMESDDWKWVAYDSDPATLGPGVVSRQSEKGHYDVLVLIGEGDVRAEDLSSVRRVYDSQGNPCVSGTFTAQGSAKMRTLTGANLRRHLGVILDGELLTAPVIQTQVGDRFLLTGNFTREQIDNMVGALRFGKLPARFDTANVIVKRVEPN